MKNIGHDPAAGKDWTAIQPLGDYVCLTDPKHAEPRSGKILMPDTANKGRWIKATVHAVGPEVKSVGVGDVCFIPEARGERWQDGDTIYLFYHEEELLGREGK